MKIGLFAASLLVTSALSLPVLAASVTMSPPPAQNKTAAQPKVLPPAVKPAPQAPAKTQPAAQAKKDCPCDCPQSKAHRTKAAAHRSNHRHYARGSYYRYADAAPWRKWQAEWRYGPMRYGPPPEVEGLRIDDGGWMGGVGYAPDGGGGGGFVDGYGQVHFANGGGVENGPTYNNYRQSFQYNPSQAGPFQPRLMGGFAPSSSGSR